MRVLDFARRNDAASMLVKTDPRVVASLALVCAARGHLDTTESWMAESDFATAAVTVSPGLKFNAWLRRCDDAVSSGPWANAGCRRPALAARCSLPLQHVPLAR